MKVTPILRLCSLVALLPWASAEAQSVYIPTQRAAPYVPLSSGLAAFPTGAFDAAVTVPIGFDFEYFGEVYAVVAITENGALSLQPSCSGAVNSCESDEFCGGSVCQRSFFPGSGRATFPSATPPTRLIAPFWSELLFDQRANPFSDVRYATAGVAPNREFVVQWRDMRSDQVGGPLASRFGFQARLHEGSQLISFHYGPFVAGQDVQFVRGFIGVQSAFAAESVAGNACTTAVGACTSIHLQALQNQVIEIGRPAGAELTGRVQVVSGGAPGGQGTVAVTVQNVGRQATPGPFATDIYLSLATPIVPSRDTLLGRLSFASLAAGGARTATLTASIPPGLAIGRYFVGAYVDADLQVPESTEANNLVVAPTLLLVGADLSARIDATPTGAPGQPGTVIGQLSNEAEAVGSVSWRFYLSTDGALDGGDVELARGVAAAPRGSSSIAASFVYPVVAPARYQVLLFVDAEGTVAEVDELNNVGASPQFVLGPQLVAQSVTAPPRVGPGEAAPLTVTIDNRGSAPADVAYEVWLAMNARFDPSVDTRLVTDSATVGSQSSLSFSLTATVPSALPQGPYHLVLVVDPANLIAELDERDNVWVAPNPITLSGPDIASVALSSAPIAFRGRPFAMSATFENTGGQTVRGARYSFHLSANQLITVSDPRVHEGGPVTLAPGQRQVVTASGTIAADLAAGLYYLGVIADSDGSITEVDESDNIRRNVTRIVVRDVAPDFVASELVSPSGAAAGERVPVQRLLENRGNAPGMLAYSIHLVPLGAGVADGYRLGQGAQTLAEGATHWGVDVVRVPSEVPAGDYQIEYRLDPAHVIDELDEDNNLLRGEDTVEVAEAQLEVASKSLPVGAIGVPYDAQLSSRGGVAPTSWRLALGALPAGLMLDATGRISGTPTAEARASFVVEVSDGATLSARALELWVLAGQAELALITRALPAAYAAQPYDYPLVAVGGVPPYSWSFEGELPGGFVLTSSGAVVGLAEVASASRVLTFSVEDARGDVVERPLAFRVLDGSEGVRFGDGALPDGVVGEAYAANVAVTGGQAPLSFGVTAGELPPGLTLADGQLSGRPTRAGVFTVELQVSDGRGDADRALFVVTVSAPGELRFVTSGLPAGVVGVPYRDEGEQTVQLRVLAPAGSSSVSLTLLSGALPDGLVLAANGQLSGTPARAGVFAFVAAASDGAGRTTRGAFGVAIVDVPSAAPQPEEGGCGCTTGSRGTAPLALLLGLGGLWAWRRRGWALAALLVMGFGAATAAEAQRPPPPPIGLDAGAAPDGSVVGGAAQYFVSTRSEPYQVRSGGSAVSFRGNDDDATVVTLPFAFRFYEQDHATASIGTNGYLSFVSDASSLGNQNFPDRFDPNGVIAAFWNDLYNPTVTTHLEGTAPQRRFVVQWANTERCCGQGLAFLNFQIHLFEGPSGRIELHYGAVTGPGTGLFDATIGFEDGSGARGVHLASCSPGCTQADFVGLGGTVLVALQDAGTDVFARGLIPDVQGVGRVYPGVPFAVQAQYAAYHADPVGPFVYRIHLVPQGSSALDQPVYSSPSITLSPYEARDDRVELTLPLSVTSGRYRLALQVDADDEVAEPDESNNVLIAAQELIVAEPAPNFTVEEVRWLGGSPVAPGATGTVRMQLSNAGNVDGRADYRVVLSGNAVASIDDLTLASGSVTLALLTSQELDATVALPTGLRAGTYWMGVLIDPEDAVSELSEIDNSAVAREIELRGGPLAIVTRGLAPAYRGLEYVAVLEADGVGIESWSVTAGRTPEGVLLSPGGVLFGRPVALGSETFTVQVQASDGSSASQELSLEVRDGSGPLVIVTRQLLPAVAGQAYPPGAAELPVVERQHLIASGGSGAVSFRLLSGAPEGLLLDEDGYLHGATARRGRFELEVEAASGVETTRATLPLDVVDVGRLTLVPQVLEAATVATSYRAALAVVGAVEPANVELSIVDGAGRLPEGLTLSRAGVITGTASAVGRFGFAVRATEAVGARVLSDTARFELQVLPAAGFAIAPSALPDATVGVSYRAVLEARLGRAPFVWGSIEARRLPRGLRATVITEADVAKLEISGTPEEVPTDAQIGDRSGGVAAVRVSVSDAGGQVVEAAYALRVLPMPAASSPAPEDGGCGCRSSTGAGGEPLLLLLAVGLMRRRRV